MAVMMSSDRHGSLTVSLPMGSVPSVHDPSLSVLIPVSSAPHSFLRPTTGLYGASVASAKYYLDSIAVAISTSQNTRQRENRRKRKRPEPGGHRTEDVLQLQQLYVDGFAVGQVWEQATRILESTDKEIKRDLSLAPTSSRRHATLPQPVVELMRFGSDGFEVDESDSNHSAGSFADSQEKSSATGSSDVESEPHDEGLENESDMESNLDEAVDEESYTVRPVEKSHDVYIEDPHGLNDGFFSIDDFNKQSELLERQDLRGDPDDGAATDEEDIDWRVDPLAFANGASLTKKKSSPRRPAMDDEHDLVSESSDEEGRTFGDANLESDLDSEDGSSYIGVDDNTAWINTSDIKYADFFAPPPRKVSSKKMRALPKTQPPVHDIQNDIERAMADVRRDLFEDEGSNEDGGSVSGDDLDGSQNPRSTHEKQRARIANEIRRLEAANVARKEWTLSGEARAPDRPVNSLIEEDLEFERIGKPVPVVTNETTEDIEELIKRRILAKEFDEVIRRRPGALAGQNVRRGRFELDDTKPQQSLAELYEADHLRATDSGHIEPKDQKLRREHDDITQLWKEISLQLDSLSNWHYKPKTPQATINVVTDVATVTMEDARPTVSGAVGGPGALAPQDIYAPGGDGKSGREVILKGGASVAKDEMTREERIRRRRRQKEKLKKANANKDPSDKSGRASQKQQLMSELKKGGVKVISSNGEMKDIYGRHVIRSTTSKGGDVLKL